MELTRSAVRVYCTLSGLKTHQDDDVIDALTPFAVPILQAMRGQRFVLGLLTHGFKKLYGWNINYAVAETFRDRLLFTGYISRVGTESSAVLMCTPPDHIAPIDGEIEVSNALNLIIDEFENFPGKISDLIHSNKTRDELGDILVKFLISLDAFSLPEILQSVNNKLAEPEVETLIRSLSDETINLNPEDRYICAKFIRYLHEESSPLLENLTKIAGVGLLTELIEDFSKPATVVAQSSLTIFLDAPLALNLLGLSGVEGQKEAKAIYDSLTKIGCRFSVFRTSCDEIARILSALLKTQPSDRHGPTHSAMLRNEVSRDYVETVRLSPESALSNIGVSIRNFSLEDYPNSHKYFPIAARDDFVDEIAWLSIDARFHDADCITLIMRLREGQNYADIFSCKYVFVSSNEKLAQKSRKFCLDNRKIQDRHCGPVISERDLATAAWLRTGLASDLTIPRGHMLSACERALGVRKQVIERAREKLRNTRPEQYEQFQLLLQNSRAVTRIHDQALGNEAAITDQYAERMIDDMLKATATEIETEYQRRMRQQTAQQAAKTKALKAQHDKQLAEASEMLSQKTRAVDELKEKLDQLSEQQKIEKAERYQRLQQIIDKHNKTMKYIEKIGGIVLVSIGLLTLIGVIISQSGFTITNSIMWSVGLIFTCIGVYHTIQELRQKPKIGFGDALNTLSKWRFNRNLKMRDLDKLLSDKDLTYTYGQIRICGDLHE